MAAGLRHGLAAVVIAGAVLTCGGDAAAEPTPQDQSMYDTLFRDKIVAVRRSRGPEDDVELIQQMFDAARAIPDSPGVQQLVYRGIVDLGVAVGEYDSVLRAASRLRERFPDDTQVTDARMLEILEQGYRSARGDDRPRIGGMYLDMLVTVGQSAAESGDTARANDIYRQAQTVARAIDSPRLSAIQRAVDELAAVELLNARIRQLEAAVTNNPRNVTAARDLTLLLLLEKHDPAAAFTHVDRLGDADLADVVRFASREIDTVSPSEALRVGDWYFAQSLDAQGPQAYYLLKQAVSYYDQMLERYSREDALRQRVTAMLAQATLRLDILRAQHLDDSQGQWIDLIEQFDKNRHALGKNAAVRDDKLYSAQTDFILPVSPQDGYDLKLSLRFEEGENGLIFSLPMGQKMFSLQYSWRKHTRTQIAGADHSTDQTMMLRPGREVELEIHVRPTGENGAEVRLLVDGQHTLDWHGDVAKLTPSDTSNTPEPFNRSIRVSCGGRFIFQSIQIMEIPAKD